MTNGIATHQIPDRLSVCGLVWQIMPAARGESGSVRFTDAVIEYTLTDNYDHIISEILGFVIEIIFEMSGTVSKRGKISVDAEQITKVLRHNLFCFLRDNPVDWRMIALRVPLLTSSDVSLLKELVEKKAEDKTFEEEAGRAINDISSINFEEESGDLTK